LKTIASSKGVTGTHLGKKFGFEQSTTDVDRIFTDPEINTVVITTRHNTHAQFVIQALEAGKHVFVEKPLCLTLEELDSISSQLLNFSTSTPLLMVGFNRRFAPHVVKMKALLETVKDPKSLIMTVNAGMIPPSHWTQDAEVGGGRIIGEACHFIDLLRFLTGNPILKSDIIRLQSEVGDTVSIQLSFADGSIGTIHYFANGSKRFPKERLEVFCGGKILQLDNFKIMRGYGWKGFKRMRLWRQDKGHTAEMKAFVGAIEQGKSAPIPFEEIVEVMRVTLELDGKKFRS
jgi:predicted dehydrogenase